MVELLGASKLNVGSRIIIEKPFGTDLASAVALNKTVHSVFDESQVFRIDHFLGKESVDNILRFDLQTSSLSRSGTATTSATSRSTFPRPSP